MVDTFSYTTDESNSLANRHGQKVEIYHVTSGYSVAFKAMMTQFEDAYTSEWKSETVYGRMDPIQTYKRTGRTISIGFNVVAGAFSEASENLKRIQSLIQFLYPMYEADGSIKNSPICKIQFLNWAGKKSRAISTTKETGLLGTIEGFTFAPDLDAGVFSDGTGKLYPKVVIVSFRFTVIHEDALGWVAESQPVAQTFPYGVNSSRIIEFGKSGDKNLKEWEKQSDTQSKIVPIDSYTQAIEAVLTQAARARPKGSILKDASTPPSKTSKRKPFGTISPSPAGAVIPGDGTGMA